MKGIRIYLFGSALLLIIFILSQVNQPQETDWTPTYVKEDKIPFGLYILHQEIKTIFPGTTLEISKQRAYNTLKNKHRKHTNYLFIGGKMDFDELDYKELVTFMEQGNNVFIAAFDLGEVLNDTLKIRISSSFNSGKNEPTPINFVNPAIRSAEHYSFDRGLGDQYFIQSDTSAITVLGEMEYGGMEFGTPDFIKYTFGKGALYLLPNPQLLTNYALLQPKGAEYAAKALSYLPPAETLVWDESNTMSSIADRSPLQVIFKHPPLRWAYYLALSGLLIFVIFEIKRRQRIIPVIEPLKNSTADFVTVVGKVYYQQRNNNDIAGKKIRYFLEYVRTTYQLKTTKIDGEFSNSLLLKSDVSEGTILPLIKLITDINNSTRVNDQQLIELNKLIEKFHQQAQ